VCTLGNIRQHVRRSEERAKDDGQAEATPCKLLAWENLAEPDWLGLDPDGGATLWLPSAPAATCRAGHELDARRQAVQDPRRQAADDCSEDDACASAFRADLGIG
jgi:hypothetical protein